MPAILLGRRDEVGELAFALTESATALWARMDATERFAADVAHEIKNPLSSIRSAIETLRRIEDPAQQRRLLAIIAEDVVRLDRLISDISDASRVDAELSRTATEEMDVVPILATLAEIHDATRAEKRSGDASRGAAGSVEGAGGRGAAGSGAAEPDRQRAQLLAAGRRRSGVRAGEAGPMVEIAIEDDGPGIPASKLEHVFERFYTERPAGRASSGSTPGWDCRSAGRSWRRSRAGLARKTGKTTAAGWSGARFTVRLPKAA